jgi:thiol-disulfide isomerase/thioredoxin
MTSRSDSRIRHQSRRPSPWLWAVVGIVLVGAALIAVIATRSSVSSTATPPGVDQTRPVQVVGDALPTLSNGSDPAIGSLIPELHGAAFDGTPVNVLRDGKPKLVLFVAHWCPHCQREVPLLSAYLRAHPLPVGLEMMTVATATSADQPNYPPSTWLARESWPTPVLADSSASSAAQAFGLPGYPYFVAVDSGGHVVARTSGEITTDQFAQLAQQALAAPTAHD